MSADPTYMIRAIPSNASDNVYCTLLAQSAVHGAMAGYTGFTVGPVNGRHAYIPFDVSVFASMFCFMPHVMLIIVINRSKLCAEDQRETEQGGDHGQNVGAAPLVHQSAQFLELEPNRTVTPDHVLEPRLNLLQYLEKKTKSQVLAFA